MYTFPSLDQLANASEEDFKELKTGFRAPYIMDAIRRNREGQFDKNELKSMDYESCIKELMTIKGVGEKVANCVSLFGLGKKEAFPVDVWIKRIMETTHETYKILGVSFNRSRNSCIPMRMHITVYE